MSTLGKVLLALNFLAAAGLAYLTVQDWNKRQEISGIVLRYHLTLQGLPTESAKSDDSDSSNKDIVSIDVKTAAGVTVQTMRTKLLDTHFQGNNGGEKYGANVSVKSLVEELDRAKNKLLSLYEEQKGNEGKLAFLAGSFTQRGFEPGLLMTFAENYEERAAVKALVYPPPKGEQVDANLKDAKSRLDRKIAALQSPPDASKTTALAAKITELKDRLVKDPKDDAARAELESISEQGQPPFTRDDSDRRRRIAHFLMLLDPSAAWQKRVITVCGLKTYQTALAEQAGRLSEISRQTERVIESEQATFEAEYDLLKRLAVKQDSLLTEHMRLVAGLVEMEALDATSKASRETQLANLKTELANLQASIAAVLKSQAAAEKDVFELQRKVGETLKNNLDLEAKLDQTEQPKP